MNFKKAISPLRIVRYETVILPSAVQTTLLFNIAARTTQGLMLRHAHLTTMLHHFGFGTTVTSPGGMFRQFDGRETFTQPGIITLIRTMPPTRPLTALVIHTYHMGVFIADLYGADAAARRAYGMTLRGKSTQ